MIIKFEFWVSCRFDSEGLTPDKSFMIFEIDFKDFYSNIQTLKFVREYSDFPLLQIP